MIRPIAVLLLAVHTSTARELVVPTQSEGDPAAGKRVAVTPPDYAGTGVHHTLYLPPDWSREAVDAGKTWPVIVEYAGNRYPAAGSAGTVAGTSLGYGISAGRFIWVTLPFVDSENGANALNWWGDPAATVRYAVTNVPRICEQFGGAADTVFLCGFSRGAIATNFIGLHNATIAALWCAFVTHDHYDGVREWRGTSWGSPLATYRAAAAERLGRLDHRPVLIAHHPDTAETATYLKPHLDKADFTFLDVDTGAILGPFPNQVAVHPHTDRWLLRPSPARTRLWAWVERVLSDKRTPEKP